MGLIGQVVGSEAGKHLGGFIADKTGLGNYKDSFKNIGSAVGNFAGTFSPYKHGGFVKGKKGQPVIIEAHAGEFIIPTKYIGQLDKNLKSKILKAKKNLDVNNV